jgi:hypothetical protein
LQGDLYIYKNIDLPFDQQLDLGIQAFEGSNIPVTENSAGQILQLAMEMTYRLGGFYDEKPHVAALRSKFLALWKPKKKTNDGDGHTDVANAHGSTFVKAV